MSRFSKLRGDRIEAQEFPPQFVPIAVHCVLTPMWNDTYRITGRQKGSPERAPSLVVASGPDLVTLKRRD